MDVLSDILRVLRLTARVYLRARFCGSWAVDMSGERKAPFHAIAQGACWLHTRGAPEPIALRAGDLAVFPHDDPHVLSDGPIPPGPEVPRNRPAAEDAEGPFTTLVCGYFEFQRHGWNPLLETLPCVIVARADDPSSKGYMDPLLQLIAREAEAGVPGGAEVVNKLANALFVHVVRLYLRQQDAETGFLAALADRHVGKALRAIHERPGEKWSVERLARVAGQSRSMFAERFQRLAGVPPLYYLASWRMRCAQDLLVTTAESIARIAERCGYESEAAFAKAFKRHFGVGPGAARRRARA